MPGDAVVFGFLGDRAGEVSAPSRGAGVNELEGKVKKWSIPTPFFK